MSASPIAAALQPFIDRQQIGGAVTVVADRDRVLDVTSVGYADLESRQPMTEDCLFWIASVTKPIVASALFMLIDEGRLSTNDSIEAYLPEFREMWYVAERPEDQLVLKRATRPITLHDLLTHTSGLPFLSKCEPPIDARPLSEVVVSSASGPLHADPGSRFIYSNAGTNTLGRVIEVVSGIAFEQFLQNRIFAPLGMTDTTFYPSADQLKRLAKVHKPNEARTALEVGSLSRFLDPFRAGPRYPAPGGGLFSTAADVTRFAQMILRGGEFGGQRLLSRESVRRMTSVQNEAPNGDKPARRGYHFATETYSTPDGPAPAGTCGHSGAFGNDMTIHINPDLALVWMVQQDRTIPFEGLTPLETFRQTALSRQVR